MTKASGLILALLTISAPAFAAKTCEEEAVAPTHAKFEEQLKKQAYELVLVAEAKNIPDAKKDGDAEFESRGVLYSMGDIRPFVPKTPNEPVLVKVQKRKGSPAMEKGKLYTLYLKKDKEAWVIDACSHSHEAKGFMVSDVQAEQNTVLKAYGVNQVKAMSPPANPDKKFKDAPPLKPVTPGGPPVAAGVPKEPPMATTAPTVEAPKEAPKNLPKAAPPAMPKDAKLPTMPPKEGPAAKEGTPAPKDKAQGKPLTPIDTKKAH